MRRTAITSTSLLLALGLGVAGCFDESASPMNDDDTMEPGQDSGMDESMGDTEGEDPPPPPPGTTGDPPDPTGDPPEETTGDPPDTDGEGEYQFDDAPPGAYTQIDRMGMPAINTGVISDKDQYNGSSPSDDAAGIFVEQIIANLTGLHGALDDDLMGAGLVPCMVDICVAQAAPLVVPDTLSIDLGAPAGFPNGRLPADPVMDVTLAVILLDLSAPGQNALSLVGLNPTANDLPFSDEFPYFAEPHQ